MNPQARFRIGLLLTVALIGMTRTILGASDSIAIPDRPAIPVAQLKGKRAKIVDFRNEFPRVMVDEKEVSAETGISLVLGDTFLPGYITVTQATVTTDIYAAYWNAGDNGKPLDTRYKATLMSDRDLQKVFLLFLLFEDAGGDYSQVPQVTITSYGVGNMRAGKNEWVDFRFAPLIAKNSRKKLLWTMLAFSAGSQVRTNEGNEALDTFFDSIDRFQQQKMIAQRAVGNFPPALVRRFPFIFSDELKKQYAGRTISLRVNVTADGLLDTVEMDEPPDAALLNTVAKQMSYWLFLPKVKDGQVTTATVVLPIKF